MESPVAESPVVLRPIQHGRPQSPACGRTSIDPRAPWLGKSLFVPRYFATHQNPAPLHVTGTRQNHAGWDRGRPRVFSTGTRGRPRSQIWDRGDVYLAWIKREARHWKTSATVTWWQTEAPEKYKEWEIPWKKKPPELTNKRAWLANIIAARTQHGDFTPYHERFNHQDGPWLCRCGCHGRTYASGIHVA